jgi:hypothetical protein
MGRESRIFRIGLAAGILVGAAALPAEQPPPAYAAAEAPAILQPMVRHANLIIVTLQGALLSELRHQLDDVGPAAALEACHLAMYPARRAAHDEGVAVGRTSTRLRNPANASPGWAAALIERYANTPRARVDGLVVDLGDRVGVLRPIREQRICASCHGPEETLRADVRARLAERYPADRAVGFHEGDIRGWFWVEVPRDRP